MAVRKYFIGDIYENYKGHKFKIIEILPNNFRMVKFIDTGYVTRCHTSSIKEMTVKDYLVPTIANVGIIDFKGGTNHKLYHRWHDMICRCYDKDWHDYKTYGARGVTVDTRWHKLSNYIEDISKLENYDMILKEGNKWHIDKDILFPGNKIYSKDRVKIVPCGENSKERMSRNNPTKRKKIVKKDLNGNIVKTYPSILEALEDLKLSDYLLRVHCKESRIFEEKYKLEYEKGDK